MYESISFDRIAIIFKEVSFRDIENLIIENSRLGILTCIIDYHRKIILFKNFSYYQISINEEFTNINKRIYEIGKSILTEDKTIIKNLQKLKNSTYNNLRKLQENGKIVTDDRLSKISKTLENLTNYHKQKEEEKIKRKEEKQKEKQKNQLNEEENLRKTMKLLKDEEAKKELQRELKKHLLDKLKSYTNIIELKGIRYRIDDLLKDLEKIEDNEILVHILEKEEINYKTQKETKINKSIREKDYITREIREKEYNAFYQVMTKEEKSYLEELEKKDREFHQNYIPMKADLLTYNTNIEKVFENKISEIEQDHINQIEKYRIVKLDDIKKEINQYARKYLFNTVESHIKKLKTSEKAEKDRLSGKVEDRKEERPEGFTRKIATATEPQKMVKDDAKNLNFTRGIALAKDKEEVKPVFSFEKKDDGKREIVSGNLDKKPVFIKSDPKDNLVKTAFKEDAKGKFFK